MLVGTARITARITESIYEESSMRKILALIVGGILLLAVDAFGQATPSGWTTNYRIRKYAQGANPGADSLNKNWIDLDAAIYSGKRGAVWPETNNLYDNGTTALRWRTFYGIDLNITGDATTSSIIITDLTASRLVATDGSKNLV